jgi:hypothetical protein
LHGLKFDTTSIGFLSKTLDKNPIKSFAISSTILSQDDWQNIFTPLSKSQLEFLLIDGIEIESKGASYIATALGQMKTLKEFWWVLG